MGSGKLANRFGPLKYFRKNFHIPFPSFNPQRFHVKQPKKSNKSSIKNSHFLIFCMTCLSMIHHFRNISEKYFGFEILEAFFVVNTRKNCLAYFLCEILISNRINLFACDLFQPKIG